MESPLKSPVATDERAWAMSMPTDVGSLKVPSAPPNSSEASPDVWLATARSGCESPLNSPIAIDVGFWPAW
jgi:hypothetical protein